MPDHPSPSTLLRVRAQLIAAYRLRGPEVGTTAYLRRAVANAGYPNSRNGGADAICDALAAQGALLPQPAVACGYTLSAAFRFAAVRDEPESTWLALRIPAATDPAPRWAARRRHLADIAEAAVGTAPELAVRLAAEAACADPAAAARAAASLPAAAEVVPVLAGFADNTPLTAEQAIAVVHGVIAPAA